MTPSERETILAALSKITNAVLGTIREAGSMGAPGGLLYAALSSHGFSKQQFDQLMEAMVDAGKVRRSGDLYVAV